MLSFFNSSCINNIDSREVRIIEEIYPYSGTRRIVVRMYNIQSKRKLFTRIYMPLNDSCSEFHELYYKLLSAYCSCTCKAPKDLQRYRVR